jgi:hypothetical protein
MNRCKLVKFNSEISHKYTYILLIKYFFYAWIFQTLSLAHHQIRFNNYNVPPIFVFNLKKLQLERLADKAMSFIMLPIIMLINKYM